MKRMLKSKEGISPILATLLLIVIAVAAVIVTYAWVMTFTTTQTSKSGEFLRVSNIDWSNTSQIAIDIINSGTADAKIIKVYFGTSSTGTTEISATYTPSTAIVPKDGASTLKVTLVTSWDHDTRYYFKFLTQAGNTWEHNELSD
jgi:flagellin-like protein